MRSSTSLLRVQLKERSLNEAVDYDEDKDWLKECECFHLPSQHIGKGGRCKQKDSYGMPCECPSYQQLKYVDNYE